MLLALFAALALGATPYDEGVAALKAKDAPTAIAAFERCLAAEPADSPGWVACQWELGWAHWVAGDWAKVVGAWEQVVRVEPQHADLDTYLPQARDNLKLQAVLAKSREGAAATFTSQAPAGATLRVRAVGDLMIGSAFPEGYLAPDDAQGAFADVSAWLRDADLTVGNLEGPLCDEGVTRKCKPGAEDGSCYAFRSPERYAALYRDAGFDVMSTANNHAEDFGVSCRERTEQVLDGVGIGHSGRPGDIFEREVAGLKVALIGFHANRNSHCTLDLDVASELVRSVAARNDIVIVSFHGGAEGNGATHTPPGTETYFGEDRGDVRAFAHTVVDAGADLVLGSGPHVLRGMEVYRDRLVAYSLGNFATYGRFGLSGNLAIAGVVDARLAADGRFLGGALLPTAQEGRGEVRVDPQARGVDLVRTLSASDFPGTGVRVAQDGTLAAP